MISEEMEGNLTTYHKITRIGADSYEELDDRLAIEEPLEIKVRVAGDLASKSISVTMRTPGHDAELAAGFLFTEGIVQTADQIGGIRHAVLDENRVEVTFANGFVPNMASLERNFYTTSSCGVCGKASIDAIKTKSAYSRTGNEPRVTPLALYQLIEQLSLHQDAFETTGGLHASALFTASGEFLMLREDVGRHNALDKVIGAALLTNKLPLDEHLLLLSGRASFELVQKAAMAGIRIVVAIGAPSSLAVQLAEESGITLVGFLKKDKFNIYTGHNRIHTL